MVRWYHRFIHLYYNDEDVICVPDVRLNIKMSYQYRDTIIKNDGLIFSMVISYMERRYIYIETGPSSLYNGMQNDVFVISMADIYQSFGDKWKNKFHVILIKPISDTKTAIN